MSTNLEIELKSDISQEDYEKIISQFDSSKIYLQTNYYIDDKDLSVRYLKCGLRVRQKDDNFELTLKITQEVGRLEINQQISNKIFKKLVDRKVFPKGEVRDCLENKLGLDIARLYVLGELKTYRLDVPYKTGLICIDKSEYNGVTDYEVECEDNSEEEAEKHLHEFLEENNIEYKRSWGTKLKKFLETLN